MEKYASSLSNAVSESFISSTLEVLDIMINNNNLINIFSGSFLYCAGLSPVIVNNVTIE